MSAQGPAVSLRVYLGLSQGESRFVWHGILFEEPNPTGSRPSDLIGLYKEKMKSILKDATQTRKALTETVSTSES